MYKLLFISSNHFDLRQYTTQKTLSKRHELVILTDANEQRVSDEPLPLSGKKKRVREREKPNNEDRRRLWQFHATRLKHWAANFTRHDVTGPDLYRRPTPGKQARRSNRLRASRRGMKRPTRSSSKETQPAAVLDRWNEQQMKRKNRRGKKRNEEGSI